MVGLPEKLRDPLCVDPFPLVTWQALPPMDDALHKLAVPNAASPGMVLLGVCSRSCSAESGSSHLCCHSVWHGSSASQA